MKSLPFALAAVLGLAATALPDEPAPAPAPEGGVKPEAPKEEAKKERKVDLAGTKALERYLGAVHLASTTGAKTVSARGQWVQGPATHVVNPKWSLEKGLDSDVEVPAATLELYVQQGASEDTAEAVARENVRLTIAFTGLNSVFEAPGRDWEHFNVARAEKGDDEVVTLTPFDEKANSDSREYVFGKDGLIKSTAVDPKALSPLLEQIKSMGGTSTVIRHEKRGSRSLIVSRTVSLLGTDITTDFTYYPVESDAGPYLVKEAKISSPLGDSRFTFSDYAIDGKLVEATKSAPKTEPAPKKDEPAPAPAPKDEQK